MTDTNSAAPSQVGHPGLVCRHCGCRHFRVIYTRPKLGAIVRLRECRHCGRRLLTREQACGSPHL